MNGNMLTGCGIEPSSDNESDWSDSYSSDTESEDGYSQSDDSSSVNSSFSSSPPSSNYGEEPVKPDGALIYTGGSLGGPPARGPAPTASGGGQIAVRGTDDVSGRVTAVTTERGAGPPVGRTPAPAYPMNGTAEPMFYDYKNNRPVMPLVGAGTQPEVKMVSTTENEREMLMARMQNRRITPKEVRKIHTLLGYGGSGRSRTGKSSKARSKSRKSRGKKASKSKKSSSKKKKKKKSGSAKKSVKKKSSKGKKKGGSKKSKKKAPPRGKSKSKKGGSKGGRK